MRRILLSCLLSIALLSFACAPIVKKPEIDQVKKVAVVSLYAPALVPDVGGFGMITNINRVKKTVAKDAYDIYVKELTKLGWSVMPAQVVVKNKLYAKTFDAARLYKDKDSGASNFMTKLMNAGAKLAEYGEILPEGMKSGSEMHVMRKEDAEALGKLAKGLGVDAVLIVQLDYCYRPRNPTIARVSGTGHAHLNCSSSVRAVDKNGVAVVTMPELDQCNDQAKTKAESEKAILMLGGQISIMNAEQVTVITEMFRDSTRKSAANAVAQLQKAMQQP
ncbi:MAG: hypothetical protein R6W92_02620 [Desulfocurvibacter africanus]